MKTQNNEKLLNFVRKTNRQHKCHMIDGRIWTDVEEKNICIGYKEEV